MSSCNLGSLLPIDRLYSHGDNGFECLTEDDIIAQQDEAVENVSEV